MIGNENTYSAKAAEKDPLCCEALVIGAGPAGAAAAGLLARQGIYVVLVDGQTFPRDKVCGDALIPDALSALDRLGLKDRVISAGHCLDRIRIYAPNENHVELKGEFACLPRAVLDDLLRQWAIDNGAKFLAPLRLTDAIYVEESVAGARFASSEGPVPIRSQFTILATGAAARPLEIFGVCERKGASAIAARVYYEVPPSVASDYNYLCISYDKEICPGYGWIFPGPQGIFNLGVGLFYDANNSTTNIRELLDRFLAHFEPARRLVSASRPLAPLRGAPLRTGLSGAILARPGLFVAGEAAGLTYSFSGEGIGKALESGLIAAEFIVEQRAGAGDLATVARAYSEHLRSEFGERFRAYQLAQTWLARPIFANFLAWRANAGSYARRQLEDMLTETGDGAELFSLVGLLQALVK